MEGVKIVFLIGWMDEIIIKEEEEKKRLNEKESIEVEEDRDREENGDKKGRIRKLVGKGVIRIGEERGIIRKMDWGREEMRMELEREIGGKKIFKEGEEGLENIEGIMFVKEEERKIGGRLRWDKGIEELEGIEEDNEV